ncbi:hypothetical protein DUI87_19381 [Hirundo rustica rustica]|uniref:ribonuclease H n=1 Tax=Hirundo rustica rustica TaxID=333673 RepID=A0A3M0JY57_HIRRU|nr:hypothetical protein DUI87_19381 [Hirundo rustica rustica]
MGRGTPKPFSPTRSYQLYSTTSDPAVSDPVPGTARTTAWGPDPWVALAVKCDNPPVIWGICTRYDVLDDIAISVPFLIDTGADVTVVSETNWPPHWKLEDAPMVGGVGGLSRACKSTQLIAITLHTEKGPEKNHHPFSICHVRNPTLARERRVSPFKSQGDKFTVRATAAYPPPPIKLTWKSSDPVWVEQWLLSKPRIDALLNLVDRELQKGHVEPSTSPWNTPVFVIPKRSGEGFRLLHDLCEVNKKIQPMGPVQTSLPMSSMIPKGQPCAVLDIKDCFFSIPLHDEDKERFAFSIVFPNSQCPNLRFQWRVLPQRMVNSPTICQITVDRALEPVRRSDPTVTIVQYMDDILIAAPSASQVDGAVSTVSETLKTNGFEIASTKIKKGPCVTFLGVGISSSYITPPQVKIHRDIKTLHDMQQLVGSLQWLRNIVLIPPEVMDPLNDLLKGKYSWEQKTLTPEATRSHDFIEQQMSRSTLTRWDASVSIDLYVHFTKKGGVGALAQGPPDKAQPILWVALGKPSRAFSPGIECLGNLIMKGRKLALKHLGAEPTKIYLPFRKHLSAQSTTISEHLAIALAGFGGEIRYAAKPPWTQLLAIIDIDLPPKIVDQPQPGPTIFTDASSLTSTAAAVWQSGEQWQCIKTTDPTLSVQQLEAAAVVLACGLFPEEHLSIVTDSIFVARLCLAMSGPGVAVSTVAMMLEEALFLRKGTISVIHVNSHNPVKGFFQIGNDKADAAAKRLWMLRDARQLHEFLHIRAKALAKKCGISTTDAKHVMATCPHCQKSPLWSSGVNPRGLKTSEIWQTDFTLSDNPHNCKWDTPQREITLSQVTGRGKCFGSVTSAKQMGNICTEFIQLSQKTVLIVPRVLYHQEEEMYRFLEETIQLHKREVITGITIAMLLGLGATGTATGVSALVTQQQGLSQLQMTIDEDLLRIEKSISSLEESISSLSEVVLQNRRGLDLLLMQQGGLCAALREECCFYADHTGVVRDSMAELRKRLAQIKREREAQQGWFESWFNQSPWLATLVPTLIGPLTMILLTLIFGPCILNKLVSFVRSRLEKVDILFVERMQLP